MEATEFRFVREIVAAASAFAPVELRLHPHNRPSCYLQLASSNVEVSRRRALHRFLEDAGIVLAVNSTVILEALAVGRPVITLDWHSSPYRQPVRTGGFAWHSLGEMKCILSR